jgi:hypothetical protein
MALVRRGGCSFRCGGGSTSSAPPRLHLRPVPVRQLFLHHAFAELGVDLLLSSCEGFASHHREKHKKVARESRRKFIIAECLLERLREQRAPLGNNETTENVSHCAKSRRGLNPSEAVLVQGQAVRLESALPHICLSV